MWLKLPLLECFEYVQTLKLRFASRDLNDNVNRIFAITLFFVIAFLLFHKIVKALLLSKRIPSRFHHEITQRSFNLIFYLCCLSFLILYHSYFINPELKRSPNQSSLFYQPCEAELVKFKIVAFILVGFDFLGVILDLYCRDISKAISKLSHSALILTCYTSGYENFAIVLSINFTCYNMFADLLAFLAIYFHSEKEPVIFRTLAAFKLVCWVYMFLNYLPFRYMLPTLYAKNPNLSLIISFVLWYGSQVWTSPLLQALYHQLFHLSINECPGESSLCRCLMLENSIEWQHYNRLSKALLETKLHHQRHQLNRLNLSESAASAKTFQTIKCVMTLKRKLRRIRENQKQ